MNFKKFIALAKENGINESEIVSSKSSKLEFSLFHGELDSYSVSSSTSIVARGIYNGKMGVVRTEKDDKNTVLDLIHKIKESSSLIEKDEEPIIFEGSKKYTKKNVYSKALEEWDTPSKIKTLHQLEDTIKGLDPRVSEVQVSYFETSGESVMANSYGLILKNKANYYYFYGSVVVKDGEEVKSYGDIFLSSDPKAFNVQTFAESIVKGGIDLLHGTPVEKTKKVRAVLNQDTVSSLLAALLSNLNAEAVQKGSSLLAGKLNTQVLSKKITVDEKPLLKNCFFNYFDDEGVACYNKKVVNKGVLLTYFHNLETARKDGVEPTGNAQSAGGKMGISFNNIVLKPGKISEEELFAKIKDGVYITSIAGLHAGLNPQSGDFSLQSEGFLVKDGKKAGPLALFTIAGNLFKVFNDVIALGNNNKLTLSSIDCPSIAVKNIKISG